MANGPKLRRHRNTLILTGKRDPKTPGENAKKLSHFSPVWL